MIILDATTKSLEVVLGGAITTNQLVWTSAFVDVGAAAPLVETDGLTNSAVAVTMVAAPGSGNTRLVKGLTLYNADTVAATITLRINNNGTLRKLFVATMQAGDNLVYTADGGFELFDSNGIIKATLLTLPLNVASGGTGGSTLTAHGVLLGQGTSAVTATAVGASNTVLHGNTGADPTYSAIVNADITNSTIDLAAKVTGILPSANGGTANGFTKFSGPASSEKTFTLPNASATVLTTNAAVTPAQGGVSAATVTLTDGTTPALDASLGTVFRLAAAGDRTIAVPTNPTGGQKIVIQHFASGGARTLALNTGAGGFRFGSDITGLTQTVSGKTDYIGCLYNDTDSKWDVVAYAKGY